MKTRIIRRPAHVKGIERAAKNKSMMPDTYFVILLSLSIVFHFTIPIANLIFFPYNLIGVALIIWGVTMTIWTNSLLIKKHTSIKPYGLPSTLIESGPFRLSRNPLYLGMALILFGADILLGSLITFISPAVFMIVISKRFIPIEESNLEKRFGGRYLAYKKRVGRWV